MRKQSMNESNENVTRWNLLKCIINDGRSNESPSNECNSNQSNKNEARKDDTCLCFRRHIVADDKYFLCLQTQKKQLKVRVISWQSRLIFLFFALEQPTMLETLDPKILQHILGFLSVPDLCNISQGNCNQFAEFC